MIVELCGTALRIDHPSQEGEARWRGMLSPEPETCAWIDSLPAGGVFFDVGANVGTFTARAALRGLFAVAFEPDRECHDQLVRLIRENDLRAVAYRAPLFSRTCSGALIKGRSDRTFVDTFAVPEMLIALRLDDAAMPYVIGGPVYVKIDVDGNEPEVIEGGRETIARSESVMIEIDPGAPGHDRIVPMMRELGFDFDPAQVEVCRERGGKYDGLANHLFRRVS